MKRTRSLSEFSRLSEFTRLYPIISLPADSKLSLKTYCELVLEFSGLSKVHLKIKNRISYTQKI